MRENNVKKIWAEGGAVVNAWCAVPDSFCAEVLSHEDFDSVTVDCQHGMVDFQAAVSMFQAIGTTDKTPLARVPWNDPAPIMKLLDAGAYGIVCPMVNNRAEAEKFVGACRYAPAGYRSFGPARGLLYGGGDYARHANDTILTLAMIETREALDNVAEIVSTPGLDGIYVGPSDLSISLGFPPSADPSEPVVVDAMETIKTAAREAGIAAGIHCGSGDMVKRMVDRGFQFCTILNDVRLMALGAKAEIAAARGG